MGTPHKHADLIKAWADGAQIQVKRENPLNPTWYDIHSPLWDYGHKYRIKPEPKPDVVKFVNLYHNGDGNFFSSKEEAGRFSSVGILMVTSTVKRVNSNLLRW